MMLIPGGVPSRCPCSGGGLKARRRQGAGLWEASQAKRDLPEAPAEDPGAASSSSFSSRAPQAVAQHRWSLALAAARGCSCSSASLTLLEAPAKVANIQELWELKSKRPGKLKCGNHECPPFCGEEDTSGGPVEGVVYLPLCLMWGEQQRNSSSAVPQKEDPSALGKQVFGTSVYNSSSPTVFSPKEKQFRSTICQSSNSFTCFNGGECVHWQLCDCSRYNATGSRCQIVHNTGAERDSICRTWGQYHYETFDGLYYFFSGKSTYCLVRHNEVDEQSFSIQVHNDPHCKSFPYFCKRSISLYFSGDGEIRLSKEVTYKGIRIQLPYTIGNVYIQKLAGYVIVRHQYAFSLAWDGTSAVYIKMAPDYLGKTHGLCGNNNAILQDELATSYGKLTEDIEEFVESWRENLPQESILSSDSSFNYEPPCLTHGHSFLQRAYTLCSMLLWPPFKECNEFVSPFPFMASCTNDLCMSGADNATWCRALTEYARSCAQAGKPLHNWRAQFEQCAVQCEEHLVYNECIHCCPVSCQQKTHCIGSELPCVDGCHCPDGLIYENTSCVRPTDCPCDYHGTVHRTGDVVYEECNNCTCVGGKWICTNLTCPAECSVSGDMHFVTFDGRKYTFQATCQYILAKSLTSGKFAVILQNAPCGQNQDGACIQSISLILNQDSKRQVTLTRSGDVLVYDQYKVNLPYIDDSFEIRKLSSVFLQVKSIIGLQILYDQDGLRLYLEADARWKDNTIGLCGTFNGNTQDDFLSPVGVTESTPQLFGNSWKTSSACSPEHDSSPMDPCDVHLQAAIFATEACSIITKELFAPCYYYLSPLPYFEQCRRDTCKCGLLCMCSALSHYAHLCHRFGVLIDFRSNVPECALSCEDTKEYSTCVSTCGRTCQAFSVPETCSDDCVEGCTCPPGMYLNIKTDRCVQQYECPCYFQGIDYPPGENIITSLGKCHCRDGIMNCEENKVVHDCPDGQIYINCSEPQTMELGRERTCENQLLNLTVSAHLPCFSGCTCPYGLVKHGDACFKPDECPCSWKGKEYFPGDKVISSCHTCICSHGSFECIFHPCPSMCTTYGDRHYRTFDGLSFDYIGNCKVYLVKSSSVTSFSIIIENVNCFNTGIICRKYIFINIGKSFIIFDDDTGDPSPLSYIDKLQQIHIWKAGFFTFVNFPNEHITVMWDQRTTVHVETGPQWQGELTGLCGNFDSKTINEMRTPENFELTNAQEFGSSWAAGECVDSSDIRHPCILNPLREPFAKKECGILLSEIFESCHPVVDVTWFYSNCLTDTCGCNQGGDCECFCTNVAAYAHQCCQQGIMVDWRSPRLCPYDCEYINKVLGKGPYKLVSYLDREVAIAANLLDGSVFPARGDGFAPGDAVTFMLTSGLYKPKAHDLNLVSFEVAERPNYFLCLASNNTLVLSKWEKNEMFQNRSTFAIHENTWLSGYSSFESFAVPGAFLHISVSSVNVVKYHHSEAFRLSTLFKLIDTKFKFLTHSTCEWRYDVCTSPCFKTCRDPLAERCQSVPKVEAVFLCPLIWFWMKSLKMVYFLDCIEPMAEVQMLLSTLKTHAAPGALETSAVIPSEGITSSPRPSLKDRETTHAFKWQLTSTIEKTKLSTLQLTNITGFATSPTSNVSTEATFGKSVMPVFSHSVSDIGLPSLVDTPSPPTADLVTGVLPSKQAGITTILSIPSTPMISKAVSKIPTVTVIPSIVTHGKLPATVDIVSETKDVVAKSFPTEETERKHESITEGKLSSPVTSRTSHFLTKATLPSLETSSYFPTITRTTASGRTKLDASQPFEMLANVTVTSFSPLFTTSSLMTVVKPVPSETSKTTVSLVKEGIKTTFIPVLQVVPLTTTAIPTHPSSLQFPTIKKEMAQTTSSITYPPSSYFSLYSPTTSKSAIFSSRLPQLSDTLFPTKLKEILQTGLTSEYSQFKQLNVTEAVSALYTYYPVSSHTIRDAPLSTKESSEMTTPSALPTHTPVFLKASTEYKAPLSLKTTEMSVAHDSDAVTMTSDFTKEAMAMTVPVPLVTKITEPAEPTGYPFTLHAMADTKKLIYLGTTESEKTTSAYARKPSTTFLLMPISTAGISKKVTSLVSSSPEDKVTTPAALHSVTTKSTAMFSVPLTMEFLTTVTSRPTSELTIKQGLGDTSVALSPYTKFSSQPSTVKELVPTTEMSTFTSSIPVPPTTLHTTFYKTETTVLPHTLTEEIAATAEQPAEKTKSYITPKATFSAHTFPGASSDLKEVSTVPYFAPKTEKHDSSTTLKMYLTTKGSTGAYQFPAEVARTIIHPKSAFSTTESAVKLAVSSLFKSTLPPAVASSSVSLTSLFPTKAPLTSEKGASQTSKSDTGFLQTTFLTSTEKATDLTFSQKPVFFPSEGITRLLPLSTTKEKVEEFSVVEKLKTDITTTKHVMTSSPAITPSSTFFHVSEATSPSLFILEVPATSVVNQTESQEGVLLTPVVSTAVTSRSKNVTDKTSVLSKQVPLSTISYSSMLPALRVSPATPYFTTTTESAPLGISGLTTQSVTKSLAEKTAGIRESIAASLFSVSSVALEAKSITSEIPETDRQILVTKLPVSPLTTKHLSPASAVPATIPKMPSVIKMPTTFASSLLISPVHQNATVTAPVLSYLSTKQISDSATEYSSGLTTGETVSAVKASVFMPSRETATQPTCVPITENECIKHICLDGQLIQVNKSQNCPYNATQPSCGFLGFAVQINGDKCCPKWECACRCTLFSDLSFITFDGDYLALFKEASYIVSQTQDETISIHIADCRNTHMGILSSTNLCMTMLNLTYLSNQIIIDRLNRKIVVNSRYAWPTVRKYGFKIEDTGFMYFIETPTNIRIQWFHTTGVMVIEFNATSVPRALGLCGFCDGSSTNDLMLPNGTVPSTLDASVIFMDSWQVPNTLKYIGRQRTHETNCSVRDCSPCLNMLLNETFSSCHPHISPDSFCDLWVQDTEYIQNPCIALAAYVAMCNKFNVCIEWRSSSYCSFPCPDGFSYKPCISACDTPNTCQNMEPEPQDTDSYLILTEGCVCTEGTILHRVHSALCIPEEKCACTDSFGVPRALGETWKTSHSGCCMHTCVENETIAPVEHNCSARYDLECQRFGEMALIVPDGQSCCHQKICTCNRSLCETFIPECKGLEKLATYYQDDSCCPIYNCECDPAKCETVEEIPNCRADQTLIAAHMEGTCCVSYICACGICSDQIPVCQEGEVLTVDGNTTDRCCPAYQCFCETFRCPEFKCVLGMSLVEVWSPEKCCPYRTCECACDTIPKPQCKLGEKVILDEQFQNSTENVCHCTKYKCCKDKVCLNNERGVLLPGQSIVEHSPDGLCHTSYCTSIIDPVTKYYQINTSTVNCAARCKSHQMYESPKDLTTCCGICKNVSCIHTFSNGTLSHFKPGSTWISNCIRYECTNTPIGPVLVSSAISCPPFNETECVKVGGYIVPFLEGCCKTCKEDGKFCKKVTVRMTIRKNDCRSNTPVNIVSCDGKCPSASIYNYNINTYARFCKCCRELGLHRRNVQLYCSGNSTWVSYTVQEPTDCSCQWS
ncbi:otogelin [Sceloporus undulatus]|uniref:otogelin n=1 Tax=Sceloporus undulatus TaxID=8520 RepID=UPI001C4AFE99|nr:otogelin [Sceloporus undulatus]